MERRINQMISLLCHIFLGDDDGAKTVDDSL